MSRLQSASENCVSCFCGPSRIFLFDLYGYASHIQDLAEPSGKAVQRRLASSTENVRSRSPSLIQKTSRSNTPTQFCRSPSLVTNPPFRETTHPSATEYELETEQASSQQANEMEKDFGPCILSPDLLARELIGLFAADALDVSRQNPKRREAPVLALPLTARCVLKKELKRRIHNWEASFQLTYQKRAELRHKMPLKSVYELYKVLKTSIEYKGRKTQRLSTASTSSIAAAGSKETTTRRSSQGTPNMAEQTRLLRRSRSRPSRTSEDLSPLPRITRGESIHEEKEQFIRKKTPQTSTAAATGSRRSGSSQPRLTVSNPSRSTETLFKHAFTPSQTPVQTRSFEPQYHRHQRRSPTNINASQQQQLSNPSSPRNHQQRATTTSKSSQNTHQSPKTASRRSRSTHSILRRSRSAGRPFSDRIASLLKEKHELKKRLYRFEMTFMEMHGEPPSRADRRSIRREYKRYNEIKQELECMA